MCSYLQKLYYIQKIIFHRSPVHPPTLSTSSFQYSLSLEVSLIHHSFRINDQAVTLLNTFIRYEVFISLKFLYTFFLMEDPTDFFPERIVLWYKIRSYLLDTFITVHTPVLTPLKMVCN